MANSIDPGALSSILVGYQSQLSQMSMALLTGSAVLLYANRKKRRCLPLVLTILGGLTAGWAAFTGLHFVEHSVNDFVKLTYVDSTLADTAKCELILIVCSTLLLGIAAFTSEPE
jgi:hypothetical protein